MELSMQDRLARLQQAAEPGEWYAPHKPEKRDGDPQPTSLAGEVLARETDHSQFGDRELIKILNEADQKVYRLYCEGTVLTGQVEKQNPQAGDLIYVAYQGRKPQKSGGPDDYYHAWALMVDHGSGSAPTTPAPDPEPDLPFDTSGLPPVPAGPTMSEQAAAKYGDEPAF